MNSGIYIIRNNINNKIYIGSAVDFNKRWNLHKSQLNLNKHHSIVLQRAYNKYGKDSFMHEIVEYVEDKSKLIEREQKWLDFFNPEYNICKTAGSTLGNIGWKHSEEAKKKMSLAHKGFPKSEEAKKKMSFTRVTMELSAGSKNPMFGKSAWIWKKHSEETIKKMIQSHIDITVNNISVLQYDMEGNFISEYNSITAAAQTIKSHKGNVGKAIKLNKPYKGFIFKYKTI